MDDQALQVETRSAYQSLLKQLGASSARCPVRAWNAIPSITRVQSAGRDRYMAFNAGRHEAYEQLFQDRDALEQGIPTASAIGHDGEDLAISILGHNHPGQAIENPRQTPATRYSSRYGPTPPSFVRATVLPKQGETQQVLVAGTASVVGEDSCHPDDLVQQLDETYRNLATVLASACDHATPLQPDNDGAQRLECFQNARVYVRHPHDFENVAVSVRSAMPTLKEIEFVHADICRPELLVEIEGVALCPSGANTK
jgi:chorismate lyase/3-hydroxybenzoate synthase